MKRKLVKSIIIWIGGNDWLACFPPDITQNKFFKTKTEAVKHLISVAACFQPIPVELKEGEMGAKSKGGEVTIYTPDGEIKMSVFEYRRKWCDLEDKYKKEIVLI